MRSNTDSARVCESPSTSVDAAAATGPGFGATASAAARSARAVCHWTRRRLIVFKFIRGIGSQARRPERPHIRCEVTQDARPDARGTEQLCLAPPAAADPVVDARKARKALERVEDLMRVFAHEVVEV